MPLVRDTDRRATFMGFQGGAPELVEQNGVEHVPVPQTMKRVREEMVDGIPESIFCQLMLNVIRAFEDAGIPPTVENVSAAMKPLVAEISRQREILFRMILASQQSAVA